MAYLGNSPVLSQQEYRNIDNISGSFNGSTTSFPLLVSGVAPVPAPQSSNQCLISVNGVVQKPDDTGASGFRISGGNIIFSAAPTGGQSFFGVILAGADYIYAGQNFPDGTVSAPSITFNQDLDTGFFRSGAGEIKYTANGTAVVTLSSNNLTAPSFIPTSSSVPTNGVYLPSANNVAISTNGTGRLFVDSSGNVGVGASGSYPLDVSRGAGNGISARFRNSGGSAGYVYNSGTDTVYFTGDTSVNNAIGFNSTSNYVALFSGNGTERLRIDSSGRLGVGTSSPQTLLHLSNTSQIRNNCTSTANAISFWKDSTPSFAAEVGCGSATGIASALKFDIYNGSSWNTAVNIDSSSRVGVGTTSPVQTLDVNGGIGVNGAITCKSSGTVRGYLGDVDGDTHIQIRSESGQISFKKGNNESGRFDTSGRLLVGTSSSASAGDSQYAKFQVKGNTYNASGNGILSLQSGTTTPSSGLILGSVLFADNTGGEYGRIDCHVDATAGTNDYPGRLVFSTTADGASSPTERMRITSAGYLKVSNNASYTDSAATRHDIETNAAADSILFLNSTSGSYTSTALTVRCSRAATTAYNLLALQSSAGSDNEFVLRGDGNAYADGSWNGGGADYAEYFEWSDSNADAEDRRGISVVLDGDKIREAVAGEDPIGVISGNPSVVGDAAWNKWSGKHLRDEFGTYILEDYEVVNDEGETVVQQRRKLNPAYDPDQEYIPREQRPEWDCVGLMGKLRIRKGQVTGSRWIKMRDISDTVEEWLVR